LPQPLGEFAYLGIGFVAIALPPCNIEHLGLPEKIVEVLFQPGVVHRDRTNDHVGILISFVPTETSANGRGWDVIMAVCSSSSITSES
jgi:hypothetical protein